MKRTLFIWLICACCTLNAFASHILGGELLYQHDSGNRYRIILTMYGDCGGSSSAFNGLYTASPQIFVNLGSSVYDTISLIKDTANSGIEVSPVCPGQINNTTCNGGTLPGIKKFVYTNTVTLPFTAGTWNFVFNGDFQNKTSAGRSGNITNIDNTTTSLMYLVATLNNTTGANNSPQYTTIPTPYYCINVKQQYNQGAYDTDGDSLGFELTPALVGGAAISYSTPYTYSKPLSADSFSFNALNGQMFFFPNITQEGLVVTKVTEYRKGVPVGSSMREMTFIVLSNCNNEPPSGNISTVSGATNSGNIINVCQGVGSFSFTVSVNDPNGDSVSVSPQGLPATAVVNIANNNTTHPSLYFTWSTVTAAPGVYTFYINYKDNHCPISSTQTIAYTINVISPYTLAIDLTSTQCVHRSQVTYKLGGGTVPRSVTIRSGGSVISSYIHTKGIIIDSLPVGNYAVVVSSTGGACPVYYNFSVVDSGILPNPFTAEFNYCRDAKSSPLALALPDGSHVQWFDASGSPLTEAPTPSTAVVGRYFWYITDQYKVCASVNDTAFVNIHPNPVININDIPASVCLGDKVYLSASGAIKYKWSVIGTDQLLTDKKGLYSILLTPATYQVIGTDANLCTDSTSVTFSDIQQCCTFSFPNAFTPNGDGRNDVFRILTYGNMENYELSIFDRWGQRIFYSTDPHQGWDGRYHQQPCEMGTYFYLLRARCLTGHNEEQKGDLTLLR
ncbi:MAG: gliding motility-associated C-terminal domain-containing protein [Taibaiella sp.]|nr:gliding motility-associated C-terminal domain-containing protein [Taibaiella sp.]